jgi:hypothetical protein
LEENMKYRALIAGAVIAPLLAAAPQTISIPAGTELVLRLNNGINSKTSKVGDPFTATVLSPSAYEAGTVRGHVARITKSGRLKGRTEIGLAFDSLQTRRGQRMPMRAELQEVRQSESVKVVDEEGNIQSGKRGEQAIKRGAIGAAAGGILGGILGGGKGALIGILVGGGAGAGSLAVEGAKELRLESGTEIQIRTVPRSTARPARTTQ